MSSWPREHRGLSRPGGNITGLTWFSHEVSAKRLELLREAFPRTKRVAVLINPGNASNAPLLQAMELAARALKQEIPQFEARGPNELDSAFTAMAAKRVGLPLIGFHEVAEAGGLIAYAPNLLRMWQRAAIKTAKALGLTIPRSLLLRADQVIECLTAARGDDKVRTLAPAISSVRRAFDTPTPLLIE